MCGIAGIIDFRGGSIKRENLQKMCQSMVHRGPDDEGIYISNQGAEGRRQKNLNQKLNIGLGHRRLSIIDLSADGHQPMCNEEETIWMVVNGEIYNFRNIRIELEKKGHKFRSSSDVEVIIHLYEEYGEDCLKYLRGMFAFCLWDEKREILFLARDRVGKKPLIYWRNENFFCFASEFSALLSSGLIPREINLDSIQKYMAFGYIPAPFSIYMNVYKLPPAHCLLLKDGNVKIKRYWNLDFSKKIIISEKEAAYEVLRLMEESIKIRLYSDVPLGAFLSGGIDSSVVVALMAKLSGRRVKTFSIGFDDEVYNELNFARHVSTVFNTEHHEFLVKPNIQDLLPLLVEHYGEPYADSSAIPTYYVSQQTKQHVTVALTGDGGDEVFAGYERYQAILMSEFFCKFPGILRNSLVHKIFNFLPGFGDIKSRWTRIRRFMNALHLPIGPRYFQWIGNFTELPRNEIYSEAFLSDLENSDPALIILTFLNANLELKILDRLLLTDMMTYLPNDLLVKVDIASMANSLECRAPLLDHKLMEFVASLPVELKMKGFIKKYILKKAVGGLVPEAIIKRKKMGFGVPVGKWFREELKDFLQETLLSDISLGRGYFKPDKIKEIVTQHISSKKNWGPQLWTLVILELWHRRYAA